MSLIIILFLIDLLILSAPFYIGVKRGLIAGFISTLTWIPVIVFHYKLVILMFGCGHGPGGGICDFLPLMAFGPQVFAFIFCWFLLMITKKKRKPTKSYYEFSSSE